MDKPRLNVINQAVIGLTALAAVLWIALFLPAWTLNYWQGWTFWFVFVVCISAISVYFLKKDLSPNSKPIKDWSCSGTAKQPKNYSSDYKHFFHFITFGSVD